MNPFYRYLRCTPLLACLACGGSPTVEDVKPQDSAKPAAGMSGTTQAATSAGRPASVNTPASERAQGGNNSRNDTNAAVGAGGAESARTGSAGTAGPAAISGGDGAHSMGGASGAVSAAGSGGEMATATPGLNETDTLIPHSAWACGMPSGIPAPKSGTLAFEVQLQLGEIHTIGRTQFGDRVLFEIKSGTVKGEELNATVMDRGLDWELTLANGVLEIEQVTVLRTDDGTNIFMRSCGVAPSADGEVRIVPDIEAPNAGTYSWLNDTTLVGTRKVDRAAKTMTLSIYKVDKANTSGASVQIEKPSGVPNQSWECAEAMGERDAMLYMASVMIDAGTISVGASKRGTRSIVPITGGTFSGRISGTVLNGGADFQLTVGAQLQLDARYTLKTDDDELIIIRNCGSFTTAVPVYETREDGPHAFLNQSKWLATGTGLGAGAVNMIIYEAKLQ